MVQTRPNGVSPSTVHIMLGYTHRPDDLQHLGEILTHVPTVGNVEGILQSAEKFLDWASTAMSHLANKSELEEAYNNLSRAIVHVRRINPPLSWEPIGVDHFVVIRLKAYNPNELRILAERGVLWDWATRYYYDRRSEAMVWLRVAYLVLQNAIPEVERLAYMSLFDLTEARMAILAAERCVDKTYDAVYASAKG